MKKLAYVVVLSLLMWPACNTEQNQASQDLSNAAETARQQKQVYQEKTEAQLRELDQKIDALRVKMNEQKEVGRKNLDQDMAELERKRDEAHQKLEKLNDSSAAAWQDMKAGIDAAMDDLGTVYQKAASHFQ